LEHLVYENYLLLKAVILADHLDAETGLAVAYHHHLAG
jgi:hypothetical protein